MILIIGYGNPLRGDDAIGHQIAEMMEQQLHSKDVEVKTVYQLTPELVEIISKVQVVIFIDAGIEGIPGTIKQEIVQAEPGIGVFTHNVSPKTLLCASLALYGAAPSGLLISIAGESFDYGYKLSPQLDRILPDLADQVEEIVNDVLDRIMA